MKKTLLILLFFPALTSAESFNASIKITDGATISNSTHETTIPRSSAAANTIIPTGPRNIPDVVSTGVAIGGDYYSSPRVAQVYQRSCKPSPCQVSRELLNEMTTLKSSIVSLLGHNDEMVDKFKEGLIDDCDQENLVYLIKSVTAIQKTKN